MKTHTLLALICLSLLTPTLFGQTNAPADSTNAVPAVTNTISRFQQAVANYQQPPNTWVSAQNVAKLAATMDTLPPTPAEARRHLVIGQTIFKAATSTNDFQQAYWEFYQASTNAPWVANIWFNMALAAESQGNYDLATNCLQVYQDFKLSDADAQEAQDKVYEIQAKQQLAAKHAADEQQVAADAAKKNLDGAKWRKDFSRTSDSGGQDWYVEIVCSGNTLVASETYTRFPVTPQMVGRPTVLWKIIFEGSLEGKTFTFSYLGADLYDPSTVTVSDDGNIITLKNHPNSQGISYGASPTTQVFTRE